ncbi:uncharacterized mitochondrial protein AtMg00810-like [Dioscorea cayenensis subsp. rotundata]|uniref:Uncharacterized mitochondrial protein AtMg00810-like n=1 Tax=Dioscorea cayennensis subsp. rotundata TaxID=55577 RepID=A0AB40BFU3_DIOCR|nr:uncharacterized mitochondrial protein AtMg00810-like [Dioscorea cayenensis subsp. rotundata]
MQETFEMTDLGLLHHFLGIEVKQSKTGIFITQRHYIADMMMFNMHQSKAIGTPMFVNEKLQAEDSSGAVDAKMYRSLVGRLLYATHTGPDISYAVGILSMFVSSPSKLYFDSGKRVLRYLRGTQDYGIWYSGSSEYKLVGFSDSDWAGCMKDKKSTTWMIFNIGTGAVS